MYFKVVIEDLEKDRQVVFGGCVFGVSYGDVQVVFILVCSVLKEWNVGDSVQDVEEQVLVFCRRDELGVGFGGFGVVEGVNVLCEVFGGFQLQGIDWGFSIWDVIK